MTEVPLELASDLQLQLREHFRRCLPNEGCALLLGRAAEVLEVVPTVNLDASPTSYTVDPNQVLAAHDRAEVAGLEVIGVAHSHPAGPPVPSVTDIGAALDPKWLYVIVGADGVIRAWRPNGRS